MTTFTIVCLTTGGIGPLFLHREYVTDGKPISVLVTKVYYNEFDIQSCRPYLSLWW